MSATMDKKPEASVDMVEIEVDGIKMQAPKGSMIIEATDKAGIDIPRFCYHRKLTIAANCRMCLVDVEKAPKPLPACATPVMDGMKVYTESRRAIDAQHGVMEFLLINHPLDCPICDQGGECELQDLAMGYGRSVSRFTERKRVVKDKDLGPLVHSDMTRCIHCTRCVRFLEEIAGTCEMGGAGRGDRMEIGTVVQSSIDSELSGNIIDLCPVGALTNKPFRYSARAWELQAKPSVAPHDGVGSTLYYHARRGRILRSVPRDNEPTNENWLSDRDRYSMTGLYSEDRLLSPKIKEDGEWREASWDEAVSVAAQVLKDHSQSLGVLMSPSAASEEYYLAQKMARALGSNHIDHRLRETDFRDDSARPADPSFDMKIAEMETADAVLLVGSNIRHEAPILGHRIRKAWQAGAKISVVNPLDWEFIFDTAGKCITAPQNMVNKLAAVAAATRDLCKAKASKSVSRLLSDVKVGEVEKQIAQSLHAGEKALVVVGQSAMSHENAAILRQLAEFIAANSAAALNILPHGANAVGAWRAGAVPHRSVGIEQASESGMNAASMLDKSLDAYLLWGLEPEFDIENPARAVNALKGAKKVIAVTEFASGALSELADVMLPLTPIAESEGSFYNLDGSEILFSAAGRVSGEARPGWKILRRLAGELELTGFDQVELAQLHSEMTQALSEAKVKSKAIEFEQSERSTGLHRIGEVPMYSCDALCRRATPLQETAQAQSYFAGLNPDDASKLNLEEGDSVRVKQPSAKNGAAEIPVRISDKVPAGAVWLRSGTCGTRDLGASMGEVELEKIG
ncbi:MAG TPA: NADH-quinone oxidoreductase subunit NuoG [Xanthomonadales bacterium]|nr:NADH-quinone oxidoreductase subunit NuoG [Xanthomonadales bacterium]